MDTKQVQLQYSFCLKDYVGDSAGLTSPEILGLSDRLKAALRSLDARRKQGHLGFADLPNAEGDVKDIQKLAARMKGKIDDLVIIGIGGSALGNIAVQMALNPLYWNQMSAKERKGWPRLYVMDNVDPEPLSALMKVINPKKTFVNMISKSGTTTECWANWSILRTFLEKKLPKGKLNQHLAITTDPLKGPMREWATREKITSFVVPENVGGR
ncbi:MAG TPA: glucose-6-phosphate isomerase, partial [Elusimicrobiota bacterium]|nr:glucose-6-phosphate isomerase [Elusimicrobiota bacterium]